MNEIKTILWVLIFIILIIAISEATLEDELRQCQREKQEILNK